MPLEYNTEADEDQDASNRELVRALTVEIESNLRRAAPNFESWHEARTMGRAAAVALRNVPDPAPEVGYANQSALADELADRPDPAKDRITAAVDVYDADLDAAGLTDAQMMTRHHERSAFLGRITWNALVGVLLVPFALVGLVINAIPMTLTWLVGKARVEPAMMATIKPGAAIVFFLVTWGFAGWVGWTIAGASGVAAILLLMPLYVYALIALVERGTLVARAVRSWRKTGQTDLHEGVLAHRNDVVESVVEAL